MGNILVLLLQLASFLFIARALLGWFRIGRDSSFYPVARTIENLTEPVLAPVRRMLPQTGPLDLSVFAVIVVINFVLTPIARAL